ncbi:MULTISPECIES: allantoate amidohydrolase [Sphingomonas]|uniref:Zn-dependent hydrolase n=1 Tax=Sphingomonas adhaesiva TaxID=28212 RepID=A0A2A4I619_9SPHN|nr:MULTISPECIES: allantoate amidohydrolase [Sphingomonas]PCG13474.1 Zn-dependent hydrolase [Sphingomonas adhaesiva]PZU78020.1 MAG: allantoate amidohydrolase [Sphingomonas sp.]
MVSHLHPGGARAVARCDTLGVVPYSDTPDGLFRGWLSPAWRVTQTLLGDWMALAGMTVRRDGATNLIGRYEGTGDGPPLLIGSHIDSVRDAGRYDGMLGVTLAIECVAALHARGRRMPFPIEVIAFGDEEGSRFPAAMLTSRAVAGTLAAVPDMADAAGVTLAAALAEAGTTPAAMLAARHPGALAYLEAHIEQGPVLEAEGLALGAVTGIAAQLRFSCTVTGQAGHAGTSAMRLRRDALAAAAEMVLAVEARALAGGDDLVATVGQLTVSPGAANVIAGVVVFTIDVRSPDAAVRDAAAQDILAGAQGIAARRGVTFAATPIHDLPASPCDPALTELMTEALAACGHPPRRLASGAGHDAMVMAALCPTAMLFIRCRGGISHDPAEQVSDDDADAALAVMRRFIDKLGERCERA